MAIAIAASSFHPFQWVSNALASRREAKAARLAMMRQLGVCTICHANVATAATDYRCEECQLEIASVP